MCALNQYVEAFNVPILYLPTASLSLQHVSGWFAVLDVGESEGVPDDSRDGVQHTDLRLLPPPGPSHHCVWSYSGWGKCLGHATQCNVITRHTYRLIGRWI